MKAREVKRAKLVAKFAERKAALKAQGDYEAYQELQKFPKNASAAPSPAAPKATCVNSASAASSSARCLPPA